MEGSFTGWFRHLTIGQKFLVSFGVMLTLLLVPVSYSLAEEGVERLKNFRRARRTGVAESSA